MNISKIIVIAGSIIVAFGILFIAQSQSVVGPESSFMYRNLEWTVNGSIITLGGVIMIAGAIIFWLKRKNRL